MPPCLHFTPGQGIKIEWNTTYNSECVPCFCTTFFHVVYHLLIQCHQLWSSFSNLPVELFWLFSKTFYCSSLNIFITCEMNSFEMFLDNCKQPGFRQCQICAASRVWNNCRSNVVYCRWSGITLSGLVLLYWRNITFFPPKKTIVLLFQLVLGLHICLAGDLHAFDCEWCFCIPRRLSLECILSGRSGVMVFKWLDFHFLVIMMRSTFTSCDIAVQEIIAITFIVNIQLLTCFQSGCFCYG